MGMTEVVDSKILQSASAKIVDKYQISSSIVHFSSSRAAKHTSHFRLCENSSF